jgi:hypothetical protein
MFFDERTPVIDPLEHNHLTFEISQRGLFAIRIEQLEIRRFLTGFNLRMNEGDSCKKET